MNWFKRKFSGELMPAVEARRLMRPAYCIPDDESYIGAVAEIHTAIQRKQNPINLEIPLTRHAIEWIKNKGYVVTCHGEGESWQYWSVGW